MRFPIQTMAKTFYQINNGENIILHKHGRKHHMIDSTRRSSQQSRPPYAPIIEEKLFRMRAYLLLDYQLFAFYYQAEYKQESKHFKCMDFLDILLTARDEEGKGLTDREIQDEVDTFLFEGEKLKIDYQPYRWDKDLV